MSGIFEQLVQHYGAAGVALGAALEGETVVTAGGFLAHRGLLNPYVAAACAFLGSCLMDQLLFFAGRYQRERALVKRLLAKPAMARALGFIHRYPSAFCFSFRFIYGLRVAGPLAIGVSAIPTRRFVLLNLLSAAIWACLFTFIGYHFGNAIEVAFHHLIDGNRGIVVAVAVAAVALIVWLIARARRAGTAAGTGS